MTREKRTIAKSSSVGFTLMEMAIALTVASGLLVSATSLFKIWTNQSVLEANQQRMTAIQQALANYVARYNRLPCAASYTAQIGDVNYGREITYPVNTGCSVYAPDGTTTFQRTNPGRIDGVIVTSDTLMIGAVPVRDLGLPDAYQKDTYGYLFTYAVTQSATTAPINNMAGVIEVLDQNGNDATPKPPPVLPAPAVQLGQGTALYALVDHGSDGKGAYTGAASGPAIQCKAGTGLDVYNCSFEPGSAPAVPFAFRDAPPSQQIGANWFDDMIVYNTSLASAQTCMTRYSNSLTSGTSTGYNQFGTDAGGGVLIGVPITVFFVTVMPFFFVFVNWFHINEQPTGGYVSVDPAVNAPTVDAYCPDASYTVVAGGCSQTDGAPAFAAGSLTNGYGADMYMISPGPAGTGDIAQLALPPLSHPVLPDTTGIKGWECNGSTASGMQTQAYAICCTGGQ